MENQIEATANYNATSIELKIYGEPAKLFQALNKARLEFGDVKKQALNPHFGKKYADLEATLGAVSIPLANNGVGLIQTFTVDEKEITLKSLVTHDSGTFLEATTKVPASQGTRFDIQTIGGAVTYARRYEAQALFMLAPEDDDGNSNSTFKPEQKKFEPKTTGNSPSGPVNIPANTIPQIAAKPKQTDFPFPEKSPDPDIPPVKELKVEPFPTPEERAAFTARIRAVQTSNNLDGRTLKAWIAREAKVKDTQEVTKVQFEEICKKLESASGDKDALKAIISKQVEE